MQGESSGRWKDIDSLFVKLHEADASLEKLTPVKCFVLQADGAKKVRPTSLQRRHFGPKRCS